MLNVGTIAELANSGTIRGGGGAGLGVINGGSIASLANSGAISGGAGGGYAVWNFIGGTIGSLINATGATISGAAVPPDSSARAASGS